jgi:hypothetical protein
LVASLALNEWRIQTMYGLLFALLAVVLQSQGLCAQGQPAAPKGPPPRFLIVRSIDSTKGEVVFDVQVVDQKALDQLTLLVYPDGHKRLTLGTKPIHVYLADGFKVSSKKAKWRGVDGKEVSAEATAKRLKPGGMVLLSADGEAVEEVYLRMFKDDTLVLVAPAEELPVPYSPHVGGGIAVKKVEEPRPTR